MSDLIKRAEARLLELHKMKAKMSGEIEAMEKQLEGFLSETDKLVGKSTTKVAPSGLRQGFIAGCRT